MATSKVLRSIIEGLKACGVKQETAIAIVCLLKTTEQEMEMLAYILRKCEAPTEDELLTKALEIAKT